MIRCVVKLARNVKPVSGQCVLMIDLIVSSMMLLVVMHTNLYAGHVMSRSHSQTLQIVPCVRSRYAMTTLLSAVRVIYRIVKNMLVSVLNVATFTA